MAASMAASPPMALPLLRLPRGRLARPAPSRAAPPPHRARATIRAQAAQKETGVYLVWDKEGLVQYVGMSRDIASSAGAHLAALPEIAASFEARPLPPGANKNALQAAWKEAVLSLGTGEVPPGNLKTADPRWKLKGAAARAAGSGWTQRSGAAEAIGAEVARGMAQRGWAVVDGFLAPDEVEAARADAAALREGGRLEGVAKQADMGRKDEIVVLPPPSAGEWSEEEGGTLAGRPGLRAAAKALQGIPHALQSNGWEAAPGDISLACAESLQLAIYPAGGAFYARHIDNDVEAAGEETFRGPVGMRICDRAVTALVYLNGPEWPEEDGGCLRIFDPASGEPVEDVAPLGGRLVVFDSRVVEHEVMPSFAPRWALSVWLPSVGAYGDS